MAADTNLMLMAKARRRRAEAESGGASAATAPAAPPAAEPVGPTTTSPVQAAGYGMEAVNKGLAGTLSLPNELLRAVFSAGPNVVNALGGHAAQPDWLDALPDAGKAYTDITKAVGADLPTPNNPIDKLASSTGEVVGGALVPEVGLAARAGGTFMDVLRGLGPAVSAGLGGGIAQQVAPGNPVAEIGGELLGGIVPSTAMSALRRAGLGDHLPDLEALTNPARNADLRTAKTAAYNAADAAGAQYSAPAFDRLSQDVAARVTADNINPTRHPAASNMVQRFSDYAGQGYSPTLTQLDQLRQEVSRDVAQHSDDAEGHFGRLMLRAIDDFIGSAGPADMAAGAAPDAAQAITAARGANRTYRKTDEIDDAIQKAMTQTASTGSGGNINNALRQQFRQFLDNPSKSFGLTPEETQAITRIVETGPVENGLRAVGKLAPGGNGLMTALGAGGVASGNPLLAAAPAAGFLSKVLADRLTQGRVARFRNSVAAGVAPVQDPFYSPEQRNALLAAAFGSANGAQQ